MSCSGCGKPKCGGGSTPALVQMTRVSTAGDVDEIQLEVVRGKTCIRLAIPMGKFAEILTGSAHMPVEVLRWRVESEDAV